MIWPIIGGLVFTGLVLAAALFSSRKDDQPRGLTVVALCLGLVVAVSLCGTFAFAIGAFLPKEYRLTTTYDLAKIPSGSQSGGYFLGLVYSREYNVRYYGFSYGSGGEYRAGEIPISQDVRYEEQERPDGVLLVYTNEFSEPWFDWIGMNPKGLSPTKFRFQIPTGSFLHLSTR